MAVSYIPSISPTRCERIPTSLRESYLSNMCQHSQHTVHVKQSYVFCDSCGHSGPKGINTGLESVAEILLGSRKPVGGCSACLEIDICFSGDAAEVGL